MLRAVRKKRLNGTNARKRFKLYRCYRRVLELYQGVANCPGLGRRWVPPVDRIQVQGQNKQPLSLRGRTKANKEHHKRAKEINADLNNTLPTAPCWPNGGPLEQNASRIGTMAGSRARSSGSLAVLPLTSNMLRVEFVN